jgi:general secretion pathway protein L
MAETLLLYSPDPESEKLAWEVHGGLQTLSGEASLEEVAEMAKGRRTQLLLPASEVTITQVQIPTKNRQRLLQAIPFTLETELAQDVEQLHFAIGTTDENNTTPVIIIARDRLEAWLSRFEAVGIEAMAIYIDLLALPLKKNHWTLFHDSDSLMVRSGDQSGFCTDSVNGPDLLGLALAQSETKPEGLNILQMEETAPLTLPESTDLEIENTPLQSRTELIELLANNLKLKQQINLLQGEYKKVDKLTLQWKRWLPAAILAAVAIALTLALNVADYYSYQRQSAELDTQIRQVFKQAFPNIKRIVDPKVQMEQQLKVMRGGSKGGAAQFASLFVPAASVIQTSPNTKLENISFRDGHLDLQLTIKELQALEKLKKSIEEKALKVEIRTANASGNQVTSHLRISGGGR